MPDSLTGAFGFVIEVYYWGTRAEDRPRVLLSLLAKGRRFGAGKALPGGSYKGGAYSRPSRFVVSEFFGGVHGTILWGWPCGPNVQMACAEFVADAAGWTVTGQGGRGCLRRDPPAPVPRGPRWRAGVQA